MTATIETHSAANTPRTDLNFVWLEITGKCQLTSTAARWRGSAATSGISSAH
jgi:hypothetical protein